MTVPSKKKISITFFSIAALGLLTLVGILVAVGTTRRQPITISIADLAEMKTLVNKYLNERNRMLASSVPANNPNVADAPVINRFAMSPDLAARQTENVEKLRTMADLGTFDSFTGGSLAERVGFEPTVD